MNIEKFFMDMWGSEIAPVPRPTHYEFFGYVHEVTDEFYELYYTLSGIRKQLNKFSDAIGLLYYYDTYKMVFTKMPIDKRELK